MSPHRRRLGVEERRAEILAAAHEVFSTTPYAEASTQHIAEVSGASQGLIFHYFGSKAGLYTAFLKESKRTLDDAERAALEAHPEATKGEVIRHWLEIYLDFVAAGPFVWAAGRRGEEPAEAVNYRVERRDFTVETLCDVLDLDSERGEIAVSGFVGFMDAVCLDWVDAGCPEEQRATILDITCGALEGALEIVES
ncbi:TetR/AcrR family transcriptional regulator [Corynebacterium qintianiae]|uniref:TetR/AcrR family transcriptional regulator n=1 Tax=Corynebacterium qintianiae TaxID=2709392 RepID=A0A7T0KNB0_9CORY|nr:TetR/AcrR family transcriptional regulator [Corynebacterium qintianiae]QPK83305.1 TetR/AcrR family transcriptional regulator [Corynebacterium qintianiae]